MAIELPHLVWIDCEMTGLSLETDAMVEIAVLVTDSDLNIIVSLSIDLSIAYKQQLEPKQMAVMPSTSCVHSFTTSATTLLRSITPTLMPES